MCLRSSPSPQRRSAASPPCSGWGRAAPPISPRPRPLPRLPEPEARRVACPRGSVRGSWGCQSAAGAEGSTCRSTTPESAPAHKRTRDSSPAAVRVNRWDSPSHFSRRPIGRRPGIPTTILTRGSSEPTSFASSATCTAGMRASRSRRRRPATSHSAFTSPCSTSRTSKSTTSSSRSPASRPLQMTHRARLRFPTAAPTMTYVSARRVLCRRATRSPADSMPLSLRHLLVVAGLVAAACPDNTVSIGTLPPPQNLAYELDPSGDPNQPAGIRLAWDDVQSSDLASYRVYSRGSTSGSFLLRGETTSNTFHDNGVPHLQYYVTAGVNPV